MNEKRLTRLTLENYDNKVSWEVPYSDTTMDQLLEAFYGLCVTITYDPQTIISAMREFIDDHDERNY